MARLAVIDEREITITPVFKIMEIENIPKSETAGHAVMETQEVVEVRFAGQRLISPVFPAQAQWIRDGNQIITYAERWPEQYRAFKQGNPQEAMGTPLEMLRPHGVTPEQLSLCRALRIYSIEALHALEGQPLKSLGVHQNTLKGAASAFMASKFTHESAFSELEALRAEIAALRAERSASTVVPAADSTVEEIDAAIQSASGEAQDNYPDLTDAQIKDEIEKLTKVRPRGNPSRATLVQMLDGLMAA